MEGTTSLQSVSSEVRAMVFFWLQVLPFSLTEMKSEEEAETGSDCMKHL